MTKNKRFGSFLYKIFFLFFTFSMILLLCISLFYNKIMTNQLLEQAKQQDSKTIQSVNFSIKQELNTLILSGTLLQNAAEIKEYMKTNYKLAEETGKSHYLSLNSSFVTNDYLSQIASPYITLVDPDGYIIGEQCLDREYIYNFLGKTNMKKISRLEPSLMPLYHIKPLESTELINVFPYFFPVYDNDTFIGFIIIYFEETQLRKTFTQYGNSVSLLDINNNIVSCTNDSILYKNFFDYQHINYAYLLKNTTTITKSDSERIIITTQPIYESPFQIVIVNSLKNLLFESNFNMDYLIIISIVFVFTIFFILLSISLFISKPLIQLTAFVNKVQKGNLNERFHAKTNDEIGQLGNSINQMLDTINDLIKKNTEEQTAKRKIQIQLIQAQIKPHFLYNILGMISSFLNTNDVFQGNLAISSLANFYRISLNDGMDLITIEKEISLVENYLTLQQLRYKDLIDYEIDVDDELMLVTIPKLTLQPLVENSIYHGIRKYSKQGFIQIRGYKMEDCYALIIRDDGPGISKEKINEINLAISNSEITTHFGLSSIQKRLEYLYGPNATLTIHSTENISTEVIIHIPIER